MKNKLIFHLHNKIAIVFSALTVLKIMLQSECIKKDEWMCGYYNVIDYYIE